MPHPRSSQKPLVLPCLIALLTALLFITLETRAALAAEPPADSERSPEMAWEIIPVTGATCGRGAPYSYFLERSSNPNAPLMIYFEGGGTCIKEGHAPTGTTGIARTLYCMDYPYFGEPELDIEPYYGIFTRSHSDNAYREASYAFVPYCTADLHAGTNTIGYDYNPDPTETFTVTHRGHVNALAVLTDLETRFPMTTTVIATGSSAGGLGALYNFPDIISRWPNTSLVTDAGTVPDVTGSLAQRMIQRENLPWDPRAILPAYCNTIDCFASTTKLIQAHAAHYDGDPAPWHAFGILEGAQDATQSGYMEVTTCQYQHGLRRDVEAITAPNLRAFVPNTQLHTFLGCPPGFGFACPSGLGNYRMNIDGTTVIAWMSQLTNAQNDAGLPASKIAAWSQCAATHLPLIVKGHTSP